MFPGRVGSVHINQVIIIARSGDRRRTTSNSSTSTIGSLNVNNTFDNSRTDNSSHHYGDTHTTHNTLIPPQIFVTLEENTTSGDEPSVPRQNPEDGQGAKRPRASSPDSSGGIDHSAGPPNVVRIDTVHQKIRACCENCLRTVLDQMAGSQIDLTEVASDNDGSHATEEDMDHCIRDFDSISLESRSFYTASCYSSTSCLVQMDHVEFGFSDPEVSPHPMGTIAVADPDDSEGGLSVPSDSMIAVHPPGRLDLPADGGSQWCHSTQGLALGQGERAVERPFSSPFAFTFTPSIGQKGHSQPLSHSDKHVKPSSMAIAHSVSREEVSLELNNSASYRTPLDHLPPGPGTPHLADVLSPVSSVHIAQENFTHVTGDYHDNSVTFIDGTVLDSGNQTPIYHDEPESYFSFRPQPVGPPPAQPIPFPGQGSPLSQERPYLSAPRVSQRKRTAGGNPQLGEEPPRPAPPFAGAREVNIEIFNQVVHNHNHPCPKPRWSITPMDRLLKHVVEGAAHDSSDRSGAPKCHEKTREAIQSEVHIWVGSEVVEQEDPESILWISGPAGTGKTAIAGTVAETCQADGSLAATFFFSATSTDLARQSKKGLITTLVYHLMQHEEIVGFKEEVLEAIDNDPTILDKAPASQLESLILAPLRKVKGRSDPSKWPRAIIIDGVDECEPEPDAGSPKGEAHPSRSIESLACAASREQVYEDIVSTLIKAARDPAFPFRILIASRPEPAIRQLLSSTSNLVKQVFLDEKYNADADITLYLQAKFAALRARFKLPKSWPKEDVIARLVQNASGQFVYVSTAMAFIEAANTHPQARLSLVLRWNQKGESPLAGLDALYSKILYSSPEPALAVTWIHAILELQSENNDNLTTVKAFLESRSGEAEYLLRNLSSLLCENDEGTAYRFFHKSLLDFLASKKRCGDLYVGPKQVTRFLQGRWLAVLRNKGPQIPLNMEDRKFFLRQFVDSFSMRYFYLPGGDNYTRSDVAWWTDICFALLTPREHQRRVARAHEIVHESCWFRCQHDCKTWRSNLRTPTFRQMLGGGSTHSA